MTPSPRLTPGQGLASRDGTTLRAAFYGRTASPAGSAAARADRDRQLAACRARLEALGLHAGTAWFDEGCPADVPVGRRPQGRGLLHALRSQERPHRALVIAGPWDLLPRQAGDRPAILRELASLRVHLILADPPMSARRASEYGEIAFLLIPWAGYGAGSFRYPAPAPAGELPGNGRLP